MKIDLLDPVVEVSPGHTALCRVRVRNDSVGPSAYTLRVVGLYDVDVEYPLGNEPLPAGAEARFDVSLEVPAEFAAGRHSLAVEITSDRRGERPVLAGMTVDVSSIQKVAMRVNPNMVKGHRKGRFRVELDNREDHGVDLDIEGQGQDLSFTFGRKRVRLQPGASVSINGTVRGDRRLIRDPANHVLTVVATGRSAPIYADATFQQRPVVPRRFRSGMAILALLGLWAGILGAGAYWYSQRNGSTSAGDKSAALVDTNGDGVPDTPLGELSPGADGTASAGGAAAGAGGAADGATTEIPGKNLRPTSTVVSGTVKAGDTGKDAGITVSLSPTTLGGNPNETPAQAASFARGGGRVAQTSKIWPSRYNRASTGGISERRVTESVISALSDGDGVWMFPDVAIPDNYQVTFSKAGFDTQSFIVTPPEDGKAVALDVVLDPATGSAGGVVSGPNGPLGGVDIVVTDGVLTFNSKTSSEAGSLGRWSVSGLSTPNTYTLTAGLRGYGTQVQQVTLDPGQQSNSIVVLMVPGVATISGHVAANAEPLGGVSITASSGDLTRSATSLTLGDSGSYSLPQLKIPGTYTITASAAGYVTQTRELMLSDNTGAVDFTLIRTTGSITGLVVSNTAGNLPGVGITVRHDDLSFNSTTAVAPSAGTFRIDELPPGDYLVTFSRYDHAEVSQLVTITAGEVKNLGDIMMEFRARPPLVETGRLVVSVFDSATVALGGATVQLLKISDGTVTRTATDTAGTESSFAFDNVAIGTYTVRVTRANYRTATKRVTMGLSEKAETFNLLQLGQVTGRIVDAVSVASGGPFIQLNNYEIKIYRLRSDGSRDGVEIERIVVPGTAVKDADGNILWQSRPTSLTDGKYELEVSVAPAGYTVTANQSLDPADPAAIMRFTVDPTDEGTIRLNDIRANPYPSLTGRLLMPKRIADPATFNLGFDPLDKAAAVVLTCVGSTGSFNATLSDDVAGSGLDTYTFAPRDIDAQELVGDCSLTVSSDTFRTATIPLGVPLAVSVGGISSNRIVNVAIGSEPADINGTVYWLDTGRTPSVKIPIGAVSIATTGNVTVGFNPAQEGSTTNTPTPLYASDPLVGINSGGTWSVFGQLFGPATYVFGGDSRFDSGTIGVDIFETGRTVTPSGLAIENPNGPVLDVRMTAKPGSISGVLTTLTRSGVNGASTPPMVIDSVSSPSTPQAGITTTDVDTGAYNIPAAAGTWDLLFRAPAGYRFAGSGATEAEATPDPFLVEPLANVVINPTLYQLAALDITVANAETNVPFEGAAPKVTLHRVGRAGITGDPGDDLSIPVTLDANNHVRLNDLPVNFVDPLGQVSNYFVTVEKQGYDTETVDVQLDTTGSLLPGADILVTLLAGQLRSLTITISKFGSIRSEVHGSDPWVTPPEMNTDLAADPATVITAIRVREIDLDAVAGPTVPATINGDGSFSIIGPPGFYSIIVSHPFYGSPGIVPVDPNAPAIDGTLFRLDTAATSIPPGDPLNELDPWVLEILPTTINVEAFGSGISHVDGAVVTITGNGTSIDPVETVGGVVSVGNLPEGTYQVEVRKLIGSVLGGDLRDERFPTRVTVSVQYGSTTDVRTVNIEVRLVELDGKINGSVTAMSSNDRPVPIPADFSIQRVYTVGDATVDDVSVDNELGEDNLTGGTNPPNTYDFVRATPGQLSLPFALASLPRGLHQLTFSTEAGYISPTPATPIDAPIGISAVELGDVVYKAQNVQVQITVLSGRTGMPALPSATVELVPSWLPGNSISPTTIAGNVYTFTVAPDVLTYNVRVTDPLHATNTATNITVSPQGGTFDVDDIVMVPSRANIIGSAAKQDTPGTDIPLTSNGTVKLFSGATLVATVTDNNGTYTFPNVATTGPFVVELSLSGYVTTRSAPFSVELGRDNTGPTVVVPKLAGATIAVAGATVAPTATSSPGGGIGTCSPTSCTFTNLTPGTTYTITVTPAGADVGFLWPDSTTVTPAVGGNAAGSVTLAQRDIVVTVAPAAAAGAIVTLGSLSPTSSTPTGAPTTFTFARAPRAAGTVTVEKDGYFTKTAAVLADATAGVDAADTFTVTLDPAQVDVTGTISDVPVGFIGTIAVRATRDGNGNEIVGTVSGSGTTRTYSIADVGKGSWTISADGFRAGAKTATPAVVVGKNTLPGAIVRDFDLDPRPLDYAVTVNNAATIPVGLDAVSIAVEGGTPKSTGATGTVTITVPETTTGAWTATKNGYFSESGTQVPTALTPPTALPITLVRIPNISGVVQQMDTATPPVAQPATASDVLLCRNVTPAATPDLCTAGGADLIAAGTAASGTFTIDLSAVNPAAIQPATVYRIKIVLGAVAQNGTVTFSKTPDATGTGTAAVAGSPFIFPA
ncbi:MAG: carboxypeptidase-like regulatory domain-containing protein [Ilumatobacteraceae bacterium]